MNLLGQDRKNCTDPSFVCSRRGLYLFLTRNINQNSTRKNSSLSHEIHVAYIFRPKLWIYSRYSEEIDAKAIRGVQCTDVAITSLATSHSARVRHGFGTTSGSFNFRHNSFRQMTNTKNKSFLPSDPKFFGRVIGNTLFFCLMKKNLF